MSAQISIIIPVYNRKDYIIECLQSVINQTAPKEVECIIVDDCSSDNSLELINNFVTSYKGDIKFVVIKHKTNQGVSVTRNTALQAATGQYIYFLDSDDSITVDCMEIMKMYIGKYTSVDMVLCNNDLNDILYIPFGEYTDDAKIIKQNLLHYNGRTMSPLRHMVRRQIIVDNKLAFFPGIIHEDNLWAYNLAKHVKTIAFYHKDLYNYRNDNPDSIMRNRKIESEIKAYKVLIEQFCSKIDYFLPGTQKKNIFFTLHTALNSHYYKDEVQRRNLILKFKNVCNFPERLLLDIYFGKPSRAKSRIVLALLLRMFKFDNFIHSK